MGKTAADLIQLERRSVDDPMETPAQLIAKRAKAGNRLVGKLDVTGNAITRIGALCYVRRRLGHHERAAEKFKNLYEGLYGSGMPAVDAGRVGVDFTIVAHDAGMASRLDRSTDLRHALAHLGKPLADRVVACVVLGIKCENGAVTMPSGAPNWRHVSRETDALLLGLDSLAELWGFKMAAA